MHIRLNKIKLLPDKNWDILFLELTELMHKHCDEYECDWDKRTDEETSAQAKA